MVGTAGIGGLLLKCVGRVWKPPAALAAASWVATVSTCEVLLELLQLRVAGDLRRYKEAKLSAYEAKTDQEVAKAKKMMADATEASNRVTGRKRRAILERQEQQKVDAEIDQVLAQTEAIRANTDRERRIEETRAALVDCISILKQEGGQSIFNGDNLDDLLSLADQSETEPADQPADGSAAESEESPWQSQTHKVSRDVAKKLKPMPPKG